MGKVTGFLDYPRVAEPGEAPHLRKRGIVMVRYPRADVSVTYFNMEDPVIGGIRYLENGVIDVPDVPGLGAVIDESYLNEADSWKL